MASPARIPMSLIYPATGARPLVKAHVEALALSFKAIGLQTPITVRPSKQYASGRPIDAYEIVAGQHRYQAAIQLQWTEIDAFVTDLADDDAELWEIDENFARAELSEAQRADHHARREAILVRKGLVSKGAGRPKNGDKLSSYSDEASSALGVDKRTVQRDLRRGKNIAPDVLAEVSGTDFDKGVVLDKLAASPRENQRAVLADIKEHQEAQKLTRSVDKTVARGNAEVAAEMVAANMGVDELDALMARLSSVTMKDFLAALSMLTAGVGKAA